MTSRRLCLLFALTFTGVFPVEARFTSLASLTPPGASATTYTYNALGNLLTNGEQGGSTYQYGTSGLLPHGVKQVGTNVYAYDLVGNLTHRAGQHLSYDPENRLASVRANGVTLATFGYDDSGERLWKQSTNTLHVWIGSLHEARGTTNLFHVFAGSRRIATFSPAGQLPGAGGTLTNFHYYHPDHLGSSSLITDTTGAVAEHYEYTAYGRERANGTAAPDVSHRFTGQIFDAEIGLYYYGARYYDANLGRFIQADTIIPNLFDPQSWNRYSYALNNPLKYTDPTGHWPQWMLDLVPSSLPNKLYSNPPGPTYMAADGTLSKGPPQTGGNSLSNLGMLRNEIEGGYDGSGMRDLADTGKTIVSFTPVGVFNDGYTGVSGKDAYTGKPVELGDQISSGSQAAGTLLGGALGKVRDAAKQLQRFDGPKPTYSINPAHVPGQGLRPGKTPLPSDAETVFKKAVPNDPMKPTAWFGRNGDGQIYRFSADRNGTAHFSGIDGVGDGTRNLTQYARDRLDGL